MKKLPTLLLILFIQLSIFAQFSEEKERKIDELFEGWNAPDHPGGVMLILQGDKAVYRKAFGLANVEYGVKNTPETIYNVASISKQFAAMGIVKLHLEGKLSIEDDIRKHLDFVPDFGETITIKHLMHHTSGLRSLHAILEMAGWKGSDKRTKEDLFRLMEHQKELNFAPGSEFNYCNTGYIFMAQIIENVSGKPFIDWMDQNVFDPLKMTNTYFEEDYSSIVKNNATSYYGNAENLKKAIPYWGYVGAGNSHTTVDDLGKWYNNFVRPQKGWEDAFELMLTRTPLNNGGENKYAFGIATDEVKGYKRYQHGGAIGGFRAFASIFPEVDIRVIMLTNFTGSDVYAKASLVADWLLDDKKLALGEANQDYKIKKLKKKELMNYSGHYWDRVQKSSKKLYLKGDTLIYNLGGNNESALEAIGNDRFLLLGRKDVVLQFDIKGDNPSLSVLHNGVEINHLSKYEPIEYSERMYRAVTGEYFSPELKTTYTFKFENGELFAWHPRLGVLKAKLQKYDVFSLDWPLMTIEISRDSSGKIDGFRASNGRVRNVWFEKKLSGELPSENKRSSQLSEEEGE